jgi:hypothetical protein
MSSYRTATSRANGSLPPGATAIVVRSTATGAVVAKFPRPVVKGAPKLKPINVAAAADDRIFYALFDTDTYTANDEYLIYRFQITSSGTATALSEIKGGVTTGQKNLPNPGDSWSRRTVRGSPWPSRPPRPTPPPARWPASWSSSTCGPARTPSGKAAWSGAGCGCSTTGNRDHPGVLSGAETVREVHVGPAGGTLNTRAIPLQPLARNQTLLQAQINPAGTVISALVQDNTGFR